MDKQYTKSLSNPFSTRSNRFFPRTIKQCFDWAQYMHDRFPVIGRAVNKVVRYFAADISISSQKSPSQTDTDALKNTQQLMKQKYSLLQFIIKAGEQLATMGNVFIYAAPIVNRTLCCPTKQCGWSVAVDAMKPRLDFQWKDGQFIGKCPRCNHTVKFKMVDKPTTDLYGRKIKFTCISPRDMQLKYNQLLDEYTYIYKMPAHIKTAITSGDPVYLKATPKVFLKGAFAQGYIQLDPDRLMHLRTPTLSTMDRFYKGWGTPLFLSSFGDVLRLAYLDKFNQAVATDFIAPIRLLSPPPQNLQAGQDPMKQPLSGYAVKQFLFDAIRGVRDNPSQWVVSPFPVNYQMLGGQAKQLAPVQLMQWYQDRILQNMAIPAQLRQTSFQAVAQSMGLRMFQRQWIHFTNSLQKALIWCADKICEAHLLDKVTVRMDKTSFVQDDMHKQTILQMAGSGMISKDTTLSTIGLDYKQQANKIMQQQQQTVEESMKAQSAQQQMQMTGSVLPPAGSQGVGAAQYNMQMVQQANMPQDPNAAAQPGAPMPAGGAPQGGGLGGMPPGGNNSRSMVLEELYQQAQAKAQQIFNIGVTQGSGARRSALISLKGQNPDLHAQVKQILADMDQQTASQAVAQSKMPQ